MQWAPHPRANQLSSLGVPLGEVPSQGYRLPGFALRPGDRPSLGTGPSSAHWERATSRLQMLASWCTPRPALPVPCQPAGTRPCRLPPPLRPHLVLMVETGVLASPTPPSWNLGGEGQLLFLAATAHSLSSPPSLGAVSSGQPDHPPLVATRCPGPMTVRLNGGRAGGCTLVCWGGEWSAGVASGLLGWRAGVALRGHGAPPSSAPSSRTTALTRRLPSRPPWPCLSPRTDSATTG